ncbi:MAG TPA: hypothetical protein VKR06_40765 [Ktedonosporobacter sp.]|nr:hypothetical protein [Ktedonosporobacter sp.]
MKTRPDDLPIIPFSQEGLRMISYVIGGYIPCLLMYQPVPYRTIEVLRGVRQKLAPLLKPGGFPVGMSVRLMPMEIQALDIAVVGFANRLPLAVPQSRERDAFLGELDRMHQHFMALLRPLGVEGM